MVDELRRFAPDPRAAPIKGLEWWSDNYLRVTYDLCMTDATPEALSKIDPEEITATCAESGFQTLWSYVQDPTGWLFYPSKIGQQHPSLKGRDLLQDLIVSCHKRQMRFQGYYVPFENGVEETLHPEWRTEFIGDTVPSSPRLWGNMCFNRPGAWEFWLSMLRESVSQYEMDAIFIDNFWRRHCGCADCQTRYQKETKQPYPRLYQNSGNHYYADFKNVDADEVSAYFAHTQGWVNQWAADIQRTAKKARPNCLIEMQYGATYTRGGDIGFSVDLAPFVDYFGQDSGALGFQYQHSLAFKCMLGFSKHLPYNGHMTAGEHHSDELSAKQEGLLKQHVAYVLAQGGTLTYIDDIYWDGRISKKKYSRLKRVNEWSRERIPYAGGVMVGDVGLYFSHESNLYHPKWQHTRWAPVHGDAERGTNTSLHNSGNVAVTLAMVRENLPFGVLHRNNLQDLHRYKVIWMNNVEVLSDAEAEALREFVRVGGGLVVNHRTGLRDTGFQARPNFLIADLIGADYIETPDVATTFVVADGADRVQGFFNNLHPETPYFDAHGPQCYVKPRAGVQSLAKVARPRRPYNEDGWPAPGSSPVMELVDPKEIRQATIGHLYAPEIVTDHPALTLNHYGNGRVVYYAGVPCYDYVDDVHDLIVASVNWAAGGKLDPTVASNAPGPVEIISMEQQKKNQTVIHALNWQPEWPGVAAYNVEVGVKTFGRKAQRAFAIEAKTDLPITVREGRVRLILPPIQAWETVVIEWR
jgi:hypothetical protein